VNNPPPKSVPGRKQVRCLLENIQPGAVLFFPWPQATHYGNLSGQCFTPVVLWFATNVPFTRVKEEATVYGASPEQPTLAVFRVAVDQHPDALG
jgi:hypothetical protein